MQYPRILSEIVHGLTDDQEANLAYLRRQVDRYRQHEEGPEIARGIARLAVERLEPERLGDFHGLLLEDATYIRHMLAEAHARVAEGKTEEAERLVESLLPRTEMFQDNATTVYREFSNPLEYAFYCRHDPTPLEVRVVDLPLSRILCSHAYLLAERERFEKVIAVCDRAIRRAPYYMDARNERCDALKHLGRLDEVWEAIHETMHCSYLPGHIARCYRDFGYVFYERQEWERSICCHAIALSWEQTPQGMSELFLLSGMVNKVIDTQQYVADAETILDGTGVPLWPNMDWATIALELAHDAELRQEWEFAWSYYHVAALLTRGDEEIVARMEEVEKQMRGDDEDDPSRGGARR